MAIRTIRSHLRRTPQGRFVDVRTHTKNVKLQGRKFQLSRAMWVRNPSGYVRARDKSIRVPKTGQVYKGRKLTPKREITGRHFYGVGR